MSRSPRSTQYNRYPFQQPVQRLYDFRRGVPSRPQVDGYAAILRPAHALHQFVGVVVVVIHSELLVFTDLAPAEVQDVTLQDPGD